MEPNAFRRLFEAASRARGLVETPGMGTLPYAVHPKKLRRDIQAIPGIVDFDLVDFSNDICAGWAAADPLSNKREVLMRLSKLLHPFMAYAEYDDGPRPLDTKRMRVRGAGADYYGSEGLKAGHDAIDVIVWLAEGENIIGGQDAEAESQDARKPALELGKSLGTRKLGK